MGLTTLTTVVLYPHGTPRAVGTQGALVHTTQGGIRYAAYYEQGGPFEDFRGGEATNSSHVPRGALNDYCCCELGPPTVEL